MSVAIAADSLDGAAALAVLPDGRIAIVEAGAGRVRALDPKRRRVEPLLPAATLGGVPMRLAVDPDFVRTRLVALQSGGLVERRRLADGGDPRVAVLLARPAAEPPTALAFGADRRLYVGVAVHGWTDALAAAFGDDARGVVLRLNPDGEVPADNPFGPTDPVWSRGLRAPVDLAVDEDGALLVVDRGWRGGRVARLAAGDHAGWPLVRGRLDGPLERATARRHGRAFRPAIWSASDGAAPTAVAVLRGRAYGAALDGRVLVGLDDGRIVQLALDRGRERVVATGIFAAGLDGGGVDLEVGLDGRVYALSPTRLYRIDPLGVAPPRPPAAADTVAPRPIPWRDGLP